MVVIDGGGGHDQDSGSHTPGSFVETLLRLVFMINIILILTLFSTLFEQLKQNNVQTVSKRISHLVNSINQANSEYIIVGPVFSRQAQDMITPCGRETLGVMQTIRESPAEFLGEEGQGDGTEDVVRQADSRHQIYRDIANFRDRDVYPDLYLEARSKFDHDQNSDFK